MKLARAATFLLIALAAAAVPALLAGRPAGIAEAQPRAGDRQLLQSTLEEAAAVMESKSTCSPSVIDLLDDPPAGLVVASNTSQFSLFRSLLEDTGILSKLQDEGPWTILAPIDSAFDPLMGKFEEFTVADVREILLGHIVRGKIDEAKLKTAPSVRTAGLSEVTISQKFFTKVTNDGSRIIASRTTIGDAPLLADPVEACNGIVYAIGGVLSPPAEADADVEVVSPPPPPTGDMGVGLGTTQTLPDDFDSNLPVGCYIPGIRGYLNTCTDDFAPAADLPSAGTTANAGFETFTETYRIPVTGGALEVEMVFQRPRSRFFPKNNPFVPPAAAPAGAATTEGVRRASTCAFEVPPDAVCTDECQFANDDTCDDESLCEIGTDCADCGPRAIQSSTLLGQARSTLRSVLEKLGFHDAGTFSSARSTGGANGSIRFRTEVNDQKNDGLQRVIAIMGDVKGEMDALAARTGRPQISLADLIQLGAAEAVKFTGGPHIPVRVGRVDVSRPDSTEELPANRISIRELRRLAVNYGLTDRDVAAITGSHTIGAQATSTPEVFDNAHFGIVLRQQAKLQTDNVLNQDRSFRAILQEFASDQQSFFDQFLSMYLKISEDEL